MSYAKAHSVILQEAIYAPSVVGGRSRASEDHPITRLTGKVDEEKNIIFLRLQISLLMKPWKVKLHIVALESLGALEHLSIGVLRATGVTIRKR